MERESLLNLWDTLPGFVDAMHLLIYNMTIERIHNLHLYVTVASMTLSSAIVQHSTSSIRDGSEEIVMTQDVPTNLMPIQ